MAKKTKAQKMVEFLEEIGCKEIKDRSKYRAFQDPKDPGQRYFVGKCGAVRHGRVASKSISVTDIFEKKIGWKKTKR